MPFFVCLLEGGGFKENIGQRHGAGLRDGLTVVNVHEGELPKRRGWLESCSRMQQKQR